ncbi:MAG: leucine-rich repeat domain-containing protein [Ureaplasma sp.]|nr:leucine-rich repeat domain-containing protein [Ureaplasma sp.]
MPNKTTSIAIDAFKDKLILENIDMSLIEITYLPDGDANTGLFHGFTNLKKITLPTKLKNLGYSTFRNCSNLESINSPSTLENISSRSFYQCTKLSRIIINNSITSIEEYAFYNCSSLNEIILPDSLIEIGISQNAFNGCSKFC